MNSLLQNGSEPPRILVVDDEEEVREILAETLEDFGYAVLTAASGEEALPVLVHDRGVAMVITDVRMPGMSGLELADADPAALAVGEGGADLRLFPAAGGAAAVSEEALPYEGACLPGAVGTRVATAA